MGPQGFQTCVCCISEAFILAFESHLEPEEPQANAFKVSCDPFDAQQVSLDAFVRPKSLTLQASEALRTHLGAQNVSGDAFLGPLAAPSWYRKALERVRLF